MFIHCLHLYVPCKHSLNIVNSAERTNLIFGVDVPVMTMDFLLRRRLLAGLIWQFLRVIDCSDDVI